MMLEPDNDQRSCDRFNYPGHIVLVHVGTMRPRACLSDVADQAYEEDTEALIWIFTERGFEDRIRGRMKHAQQNRVRFVFTDEIPLTPIHTEFTEKRKFPPGGGDFWRLTSERFYYLYDLLSHLELQVVVHIESDVMIYAPLTSLINNRRKQDKVLYPLDKSRGIASVIFFEDAKACEMLCRHGIDVPAAHDMDLLENFFNAHQGQGCASLPTIPEALCKENGWDEPRYSRPDEEEWGLFDAAALGQFLLGIDSWTDTRYSIGFKNENTDLANFLEPKFFSIDNGNFTYNLDGNIYNINNLHIHSKKTYLLRSIANRSFTTNGLCFIGEINELLKHASHYIFHGRIESNIRSFALKLNQIDLSLFHIQGTTKVNSELFRRLEGVETIFCESSVFHFFTERILPNLETPLRIILSDNNKISNETIKIALNQKMLSELWSPSLAFNHPKHISIADPGVVSRAKQTLRAEYNNLESNLPHNYELRKITKNRSVFYPIPEWRIRELSGDLERDYYYINLARSMFAVIPNSLDEQTFQKIISESSTFGTIVVVTDDVCVHNSYIDQNCRLQCHLELNILGYLKAF